MNAGTVGNLHALLIGIDHYLGTLLPDHSYYPRLGGCVRDIKHVEAFLISRLGLQPDHILKLSASLSKEEQPLEPEQQRPTYANMVRALKELTARARPRDRVIVYYSGHGGRARTAFTEIKGEDGLDEALAGSTPASRLKTAWSLHYRNWHPCGLVSPAALPAPRSRPAAGSPSPRITPCWRPAERMNRPMRTVSTAGRRMGP